MDGWKVWMAWEGKAVASADLDLMMLRRALLQSLCVISVFFSVQEQQPRPCRNCQLESIKNNVRQESGNEEAKSFESKRNAWLLRDRSIDRSIHPSNSEFVSSFFLRIQRVSWSRKEGKKKKRKIFFLWSHFPNRRHSNQQTEELEYGFFPWDFISTNVWSRGLPFGLLVNCEENWWRSWNWRSDWQNETPERISVS